MTDEPTEQPPPRSSPQPSSQTPEQPTAAKPTAVQPSAAQPSAQPSEQPSAEPPAQPGGPQGGDVVDLLLRQHAAIRRLCDAVLAAPSGGRDEPFRALLRLLAVHEAVEEEIVHPYVKRRVEGSRPEVEHRIDEEREVNRMLVALDALGPDGPGFDELFPRFRTALLAHTDKEESSEFASLRSATHPVERRAMAAAVRVASVLAPTHPHPGNESGARTVLVGTPLAMIDRARDMVRGAMVGAQRTDGAGG
jgi:hemerythrin superfamily protein